MTAKEIIKKAILMLGYNDIYGNTGDARLQAASLNAINMAYADLFYLTKNNGFVEISDAEQLIDLDEKVLNNVLPYGVAAHLAQSIGDMDNQQYFSYMYNQRRKTVVLANTIQDVIPSLEG